MNIDYASLKLNNFLSILRYPAELGSLMDNYFSDLDEIQKEIQINNVLTFLDHSQNIIVDVKRICEMLSRKDDSLSGFVYGLSGVTA